MHPCHDVLYHTAASLCIVTLRALNEAVAKHATLLRTCFCPMRGQVLLAGLQQLVTQGDQAACLSWAEMLLRCKAHCCHYKIEAQVLTDICLMSFQGQSNCKVTCCLCRVFVKLRERACDCVLVHILPRIYGRGIDIRALH